MKVRFALGLLSGTSALACATAVHAQEATADVGSAAEAAVDDLIVVTGSRIARDGSESPVPMTVVSTEQLQNAAPATTVVQALTELPAFASTGPQNRPGNGGGNGGARQLSLRNLGGNRTLVLFDGRRVPPTSATAQVNADFVPSMLLERVDVVTGGVSAVYGSDAVAGVVNFITDTDYTGLKVDARFGISQLNDAENYRLGIAGGADLFGGRGHIMGSYEYYYAPGVFDKLTRRFGRNNYSIQGLGTEAAPYIVVRDTRLNQTSFLGSIVSRGNTSSSQYNNQGNLIFLQNSSANAPSTIYQQQEVGTPVPGRPTVSSGGQGGYFFNASLEGLQRQHLVYGRFDYELTDDINFFLLGTYMNSHNRNAHESVEFRLQEISSTNAFLPITLQNALTTGPNARQSVFASKIITQVDAKTPDSYAENYMAVAGVEGSLGDFDWEVAYQRAHSNQDTRLINNTDNLRAAAALDAVDEGFFNTGVRNGNVVCRVTLTNPGLYPGCVPLNIFGPTSESPEALNYILTTTQFVVNTSLDTFNAQIAGPIFELPAGDVGLALSAEYRTLSYRVDGIDPNPVGVAACTGLRYNCGANTLRYQSNVRGSRSPVSQDVKEAAAEIAVPLVRDTPFVEDLNFSGAVRWTDYSNSGVVYTWKAGLEWAPFDSLRFRATRSRDIRAPNLVDLYAPRNVNPSGQTDRLTGIVGQIPVITDSNPNLQPEIGNTFTAGLVFQPTFLPRFTLAVDYYNIKISNAISNLQGQNEIVQTICVNTQGADPLCSLIDRPLPWTNTTAANFPTAFYTRPINADLVTTHGIDVEMSYSFDVGPGTISLRSIANYQPELATTRIALGGTPENVMGADENPKLKITSFVNYRNGPFSVDLRHRWWSSEYYDVNQIPSNSPTVAPLIFRNLEGKDRVPSYQLFNLTLGYDINDETNVYFGVTNLLDKQPTPIGRIGGPAGVPGLFGGFRNGEDTLGRFFTFGLRFRG
jgi:iron complex outermembrane receptor protein